jgi:hypothetical protein
MDVNRLSDEHRLLAHAMRCAQSPRRLILNTMDWMLHPDRIGPANIVIWIARPDEGFDIGGYIKHDVTGEAGLLDKLLQSLLTNELESQPRQIHNIFSRPSWQLRIPEIRDMHVAACSCIYFGKMEAVVAMFRAKGETLRAFSPTDCQYLRMVSALLAPAYVSIEEWHRNHIEAAKKLAKQKSKAKAKPKAPKLEWWQKGEEQPEWPGP